MEQQLIQVTYDTKEDYDVEWSCWKRMYMPGTYEEVKEHFEKAFPEMRAMSYDKVRVSVEYVK